MIAKRKLQSLYIVSSTSHRRYVKKALDHETNNIPISKIKIFNECDRKPVNIETKFKCNLESTDECHQNKKVDEHIRVNDLNIQMLSWTLYKQIFNNVKHEKDPKLMDLCLAELKKHSLPGPLQKLPDVNLQLPEIMKGDLEYHFYELGKQQSEPYRILIDQLLQPIPKMPKKWMLTPGWTKYSNDQEPVLVSYPAEESLVFDVEVCCKEGDNPVIATAVSSTNWYCWVSEDLCVEAKKMHKSKLHNYRTDEFINLETDYRTKCTDSDNSSWLSKPKIIVGHHVAYDRARIKEQYWLTRTGLRFLDTMSLHIAICGITTQQKLLLRSGKAKYESWFADASQGNSLAEIYKFYCNEELKKEERNIFVTGDLKDVRDNFQDLVSYCAKDVQATHKIFTFLWPSFKERFPHPVSLAGMLELSMCYLPVNSNWKRYIEDTQETFNDLHIESKFLLSKEANKSCQLLHGHKYKDNIWLWDQQWEQKELKLKKVKQLTKKMLQEKSTQYEVQEPLSVEADYNTNEFDCGKLSKLEKYFSELLKSKERLPKRIPYLANYPEWYRKLCSPPLTNDWIAGPQLLSTSMACTPKLLSLTWNFMPLHRVKEKGWCYIVPYETEILLPEDEIKIFPLKKFIQHYLKMKQKGVLEDKTINIEEHSRKLERFLNDAFSSDKPNTKFSECDVKCGLIKLPHKNGADLNVGNPLSRDFLDKYSNLEISCNNKNTQRIIKISRQLSYWKNNKDRIEKQLIVWLRGKELPNHLRNYNIGVILPQVITCGTLTRRAVESTWMTASNADNEKIGSELRSMIQAPPGYCFIGADVDSQELWIASLIGDSYFAKEHGCTPFSWMTLSGQKADGTDMHSMTAKTMGISRNNAKVINYARIYGAGMRFSKQLLQQFIPDISDEKASTKVKLMFETTKGTRIYRLKNGVLPDLKKRVHSKSQAKRLCLTLSKNVDELFESPKWNGGSESAMFNSLEEIACHSLPTTPFLQASLSKAVVPSSPSDTGLLPTRINWVVQSSAVDFLHLMLVCMRWLIDPKIRFCLSFHDEVRYLVPEKHKYSTALALHVTNLLVRSFFVKRLGMTDLPQSVAFFSSVEVDYVFRKDASLDCVTPSNPHGLHKGYGIPPGESLDISQAIEKAKSQIGVFKINSKL